MGIEQMGHDNRAAIASRTAGVEPDRDALERV